MTNEEFGIVVIQDEDNSCLQKNPIINKGDKVVLSMACSSGGAFGREIPERTDVYGRVLPEIGSPCKI